MITSTRQAFTIPKMFLLFFRISFSSHHCERRRLFASLHGARNKWLPLNLLRGKHVKKWSRRLTHEISPRATPSRRQNMKTSCFALPFGWACVQQVGEKENLFHSELICEDFVSCREILRKINGTKLPRFLLLRPPFPGIYGFARNSKSDFQFRSHALGLASALTFVFCQFPTEKVLEASDWFRLRVRRNFKRKYFSSFLATRHFYILISFTLTEVYFFEIIFLSFQLARKCR